MNRRKMIEKMGGAAVIAAASPLHGVYTVTSEKYAPLKGNLHHSVSQWCYGDIKVECQAAMNLMKDRNYIILPLCRLS